MTDYSPDHPVYGPFFGVMGATSAMVFSALGAAYGTAKSGTGIAAMSVMRPELIMKSIIPVVSIRCDVYDVVNIPSSQWIVIHLRVHLLSYFALGHGWYHCHLRFGRSSSNCW